MTKFPIQANGTKQCAKCAEFKPLDRFSLSRQGVRGPVYRSNCKECQATEARKWFRDNSERHAATKHRWNLKTAYGVTPERYAEMLAEQDGKCAICGKTEVTVRRGTTMRLSLDHCHATGKVRGLLCNRCNRSIGLMEDNVDLLRKAIDYLER